MLTDRSPHEVLPAGGLVLEVKAEPLATASLDDALALEPELLMVDADENQDVLMRYGVMSIPTLILFKDGEPVVRITGFQPKDRITNQLKPHLA